MRRPIFLFILFAFSSLTAVEPLAAGAFRAGDAAEAAGQVSQERDWHPLIRIPAARLPAVGAVWVRHRGGPVQAKWVAGNEQIEGTWSYAKTAEWTWACLHRGAVGKAQDLLVIRGSGGGTTAIDQVVLDPEGSWQPGPAEDGMPTLSPAPTWAPSAWMTRRAAFHARATPPGAVVFLGDSITAGFDADAAFPGVVTANQGISGDLSANLGVRLREDVLPLKPRAVVLLAGTNDLKDGHPAEKVAARLLALVDEAHAAGVMPILCLVMPRGRNLHPERVQACNAILAEGKLTRPWLKVCDAFAPMAEADGSAKPACFGDGVHPNAAGYRAWTEALRPHILEVK